MNPSPVIVFKYLKRPSTKHAVLTRSKPLEQISPPCEAFDTY